MPDVPAERAAGTGTAYAATVTRPNGWAGCATGTGRAWTPVLTATGALDPDSDLSFVVVDLAAMSTVVVSLEDRRSGTWQDVLSDTGTGVLVVQNDDPDGDELTFPNRLVNCYYQGILAFTLLPEAVERTLVSHQEDAEQVSRFACRGHTALLDRAVVYPTLGVGRRPIEEDRGFNWTSVIFDDSAWTAGHVVSSVGNAKTDWSGNWTEDFADDTASIIWDVDGSTTEAVPGTVYIRQDFTIAQAGSYTLEVGMDNFGEVYLDGQLMMSPGQTADTAGNGWSTTARAPVDLSAGAHVIASRVVGVAFAEPATAGTYPGSQFGNPAGASWSLHVNDATTSDLGTLVAHSDSSSVILARPSETPGMTPGQVMGLVIDEAQARGALTYLTTSFDDVYDTDGTAWPVIADIATKVGTTLLTFFRELSGTYIDFRLRPGTTILDAYEFGTYGTTSGVDYHSPTDVGDPTTGNLTEHHEVSEA